MSDKEEPRERDQDSADNEATKTHVSADHGGMAAGRDIIDKRDQRDQRTTINVARHERVRPPRWDSPDLMDCPSCGSKWVSRLAVQCPTCMHDIRYAREVAAKERRFRWELTIVAIPILVSAFVYTPTLEQVSIAGTASSALLYSMGNLLKVMSSILTLTAAWQWWRWWRGRKKTDG